MIAVILILILLEFAANYCRLQHQKELEAEIEWCHRRLHYQEEAINHIENILEIKHDYS